MGVLRTGTTQCSRQHTEGYALGERADSPSVPPADSDRILREAVIAREGGELTRAIPERGKQSSGIFLADGYPSRATKTSYCSCSGIVNQKTLMK